MSGVLAMILAGGEEKRLRPLTSVRTKPAVPFGGNYRIIDFALSNFVNSGFLKIFVLTQFKSHSLMQHLRKAGGYPDSGGISSIRYRRKCGWGNVGMKAPRMPFTRT